jgi:MFS family permease
MDDSKKAGEPSVAAAIAPATAGGMFAPLRTPVFRRIWPASVLSNFGSLIQGVGAAWAMTQMTGEADMVALVQTAQFLPLMLCSVTAGAIADMYDRRRIAIFALAANLVSASMLTLLALTHLLNPVLLLGFCFAMGLAGALFSPSWQASVREQVEQKDLPAAIALNSISYNIARSFGPAIGGVVVAAAGSVAAFGVNALSYAPMLVVMLLWKRRVEPSRLPPEGIGRAIISGVRFVFHSPPLRTVCLRILITMLAGSSASALMPMVARQLLGGDASVFGLILGAFGIGAVMGALGVAKARTLLSNEKIMLLTALLMGPALVGVGLSRSVALTAALLVVSGAVWTMSASICNITIQTSSPRWVTGRALAIYQTAVTAGIAVGSWFWGEVAVDHGIGTALIISGMALAATAVAAFVLPMPRIDDAIDHSPLEMADPETRLELTGRSGPIVLTLQYRVPVADARAFYGIMQKVQKLRQKTGGYGWSIARDIADPEMWTERYHTPTWLDYLRQRSRATVAEMDLIARARAFSTAGPPTVRRDLERPFGSVRWTDEAPDDGVADTLPIGPQAGAAG